MTNEIKCPYCDKPATLRMDEQNLCDECLREICSEALESLVAEGKFVRSGVDPVTGQQLYQSVERADPN